MLGYIDWLIIAIAALAAMGAVFLLLPSSSNQEAQQLRIMRLQAENDRKRIAEVLEITQTGVQDAESLLKQLNQQIEHSNRNAQATQTKAEQSERILERVATAEHEMRDISSQLGDRLQHLQSYWDEQLGDSVESVKKIRSKLHEGLTQVDDSIQRLREQEKMAQGFTRRLIEHHQQQSQYQQENARLSAEVHTRLEEMLKESSVLLEQMQRYQHDADNVFQKFSTDMEGLETQANEHFTTLFQSTDLARHELKSGLDESRQHVETMRRREEQSNELTRRIHEQFEQIDHIRVERIAKTLDLTEQMSTDLHKGMENARELLSSLEVAVQGITSSLNQSTAASDTSTTEAQTVLPSTPVDSNTTTKSVATPEATPDFVAPKPVTAAATTELKMDAIKAHDKANNDFHAHTDHNDALALLDTLDDAAPHNLVALRAYR
jgi:uncharacterized phage infection (PIP) family protein YhgE